MSAIWESLKSKMKKNEKNIDYSHKLKTVEFRTVHEPKALNKAYLAIPYLYVAFALL